MSSQITTAMVEEYSANVTLLAQQAESVLQNTVHNETVHGKTHFFEQIGPTTMNAKVTRHGDTVITETDHFRRMVTMLDYYVADLIDPDDVAKLLLDPASQYLRNFAMAGKRKIDELLYTAFDAAAATGVAGEGSTSFLSSMAIAHASTGLTLTKIRAAKNLLDKNSVPKTDRYLCISPDMLNVTVLADTTATSADYNTVKALVDGQIDHFLGFKWVMYPELPVSSTANVYNAFAYHKDGMALGWNRKPKNHLDVRPDKQHDVQVKHGYSLGATRLQEKLVCRVGCYYS